MSDVDYVTDYNAGDINSEIGSRLVRNSFGEYVDPRKDDVPKVGLGGRRPEHQSLTPHWNGLSAYDRHMHLMGVLTPSKYSRHHKNVSRKRKRSHSNIQRTDYDVLRDKFKFIRDDNEDAHAASESNSEAWEIQLARKYYDRLFKEYALCDLSKYKSGNVGLRWRTKPEVLDGKGQFICASLTCDSSTGLHSYELKFAYREGGDIRRTLVKVRVCKACALKLFYKKIKRLEKMRKHSVKKNLDQEATSSNAINLEELRQDPHKYVEAARSFNSVHESTCIDSSSDVANEASSYDHTSQIPEEPSSSKVKTEKATDINSAIETANSWSVTESQPQEAEPKKTIEDDMDAFLDDLFL